MQLSRVRVLDLHYDVSPLNMEILAMHLNITVLMRSALFLAAVPLLTACPLFAHYTIGGTVTGLTDSVMLHEAGGDNLVVSANGAFTFITAVTSGAYNVTILTQPFGQTCTVTGGAAAWRPLM